MKNARTLTLATAVFAVAGIAPALAHPGLPGHEHGGLAPGLLHPLGGLDHLLAMLAVGIWSALAARGAGLELCTAPAAFVAAMLAGAGLGHAGLALPLVETGIALSIVLLGLAVMTRIELSTLVGAGLVAAFALVHGHAHGAEAVGHIGAYMAGFVVVTAGLNVAGIVIGRVLSRVRHAPEIAGAAIAAAGASLFAS